MSEPVQQRSDTPPADAAEQTDTAQTEAGADPSNTPVEQLTAPLDPDDDVHTRLDVSGTSRLEQQGGADQ